MRKSAQKLINAVCGCPCIPLLLQAQCSVCNHFFKLSPMKLLWPALQLKATGQKSLIFVVGLFWVWCKQLRSLPYLPRVGLLADPAAILMSPCLLGQL